MSSIVSIEKKYIKNDFRIIYGAFKHFLFFFARENDTVHSTIGEKYIPYGDSCMKEH